ncbi:alpha/beta-hydrolase [Mycena belliarum]|uniref:Alpha/beta-hydrolase n=1 Tax=Mycena belliarum TaxID=1033014 RepID=A0AAD6XWT8_9AGAR|nr:alpha/beta-hydrolase [Mycena belliae]
MIVDSYSLAGQSGLLGMTLTYKRYRPEAIPTIPDSKSTVLILAHSVGTHKETWEPVIERLFRLQSTSPGATVTEVWSVDSPNHGEAAAYNERLLLGRPYGISGYDCAQGIRTLINSGLITNSNVVCVGHSAGACVLILSTIFYRLDSLPYSSMILIEPTMMRKETLAQSSTKASEFKRILIGVKKRRDVWASREIARTWFRERLPWRRWDARVIDGLVKHGLVDLPTAAHPEGVGVTLACTREQEAAGYMYEQDGVDAIERLRDLCSRIPVHCIFGAEIDLVPEEIRLGICDATVGRRMATITKIPDAGHLVAHEKPDEVAEAIWMALNRDYSPNILCKL